MIFFFCFAPLYSEPDFFYRFRIHFLCDVPSQQQPNRMHRKSACGNYATFLCCSLGGVRFFLLSLQPRLLLKLCFMHETDININKCQSFYFFYTFFAFLSDLLYAFFWVHISAPSGLSKLVFCGMFFSVVFSTGVLFRRSTYKACALLRFLAVGCFDPSGIVQVDIFRDNEAMITQALTEGCE